MGRWRQSALASTSAARQRQATAADARGEVVAQPLQRGNALIEQRLPLRRQALPVGGVGGAAVAQAGQRRFDLLQAQAHRLGRADEGHTAQRAARVDAVAAAAA
jgi:hypothetical protein